MTSLNEQIARGSSSQAGTLSIDQLDQLGLDRRARSRWVSSGRLVRLGPRSYAVAGAPPSWMRSVWAGWHDVGGQGVIAGRTGCRLAGLDGFIGDDVEILVERSNRGRRSPAIIRSTDVAIDAGLVHSIDGLRCLNAHGLILTAPLFGFSRDEMERAVDSAIRKRLVSEQRLRTAAIGAHRTGVNGSRRLLDVLIDSGGESKLERLFLRIVREAALPKPELQRIFRTGSRTIARVDALFPGNLVVELDGHGSHATRQERQRDAQRRTELLLSGCRVLTFTYDDVRFRPDWVLAQVIATLRLAA